MATVIWNMPVVSYADLASLQIYKDMITDFNTQMLAVGLLEVGNNTTQIANATVPSVNLSINTDHTITTVYYKLPTGNGKVLYDDVPGQTYKKINKASYDPTNVYVAFRFNLWKGTSTNSTNLRESYLTIETLVSFDGIQYSSCGYGHERTGVATAYTTSNTTQTSRECFVHLSRNSFVVSWGNIQYKTNVPATQSIYMFNWKTQAIHFSLVRNKGNIDVCTPDGYFSNPDANETDDGATSFMFRNINFNKHIANIQDRKTTSNIKSATFTHRDWLFSMPGVKDSKILTVPFYYSNVGVVGYNPFMTIIKQSRLGGIEYVDLITLFDDTVPIIAKYLKLGSIVNRYKPYFDRQYQYAYMFDDYILTTENL